MEAPGGNAGTAAAETVAAKARDSSGGSSGGDGVCAG